MNNTSAIPWLPTTSAMEAEEASLAEQVSAMLHAERQVMILITGRDSGRVSGFLAELTHAVSDTDSVLRIKAAVEEYVLFELLAGQLNLPTQGLTPMQVATKVGDRLVEKAANGNFVLLCEGAHEYSNALLESIRQLSNYPINIVLSGRPKLYRRLWRPALSALRQRMNYRLNLNEWQFTSAFKWLAALLMLGAVTYFAWNRMLEAPVADPAKAIAANPQHTSVVTPVPALTPPPNAAPEEASTPDTGISLIMDPTLKHPAKP